MVKTEISIVVPVYQGAGYLPELLSDIALLRKQMERSGLPLEIAECICVDDASADNSLEVLYALADSYPWLRVLPLSRNFGQHPATIAGILHSSGDWLVTLDEDLQHHPKHIPALLLEACKRRQDIVYAKPTGSVHKSIYRDASSRLAKACAAKLAGNRFVQEFNSFRLIRGTVGRAAAASCASETYFDIALTWFTQRIGSLRLAMTDKRLSEGKKSGYKLRSLLKHAIRLLVTSDSRILRFGSRIGFLGMIVGLVLVVLIAAGRTWWPNTIPVQGWASTMVALLLVNSLIAMQCGIAMKFLSLVLQRSQGRPTFCVVDRSGDEALLHVLERFVAEKPLIQEHHQNVIR